MQVAGSWRHEQTGLQLLPLTLTARPRWPTSCSSIPWRPRWELLCLCVWVKPSGCGLSAADSHTAALPL